MHRVDGLPKLAFVSLFLRNAAPREQPSLEQKGTGTTVFLIHWGLILGALQNEQAEFSIAGCSGCGAPGQRAVFVDFSLVLFSFQFSCS